MSDTTQKPTITIRKDGPLLVTGDVTLTDHEGNVLEPPKLPFALCRCGASDRKPYCDGTHKNIGFCGTAAEVGAE
ncbi:MAG: CDGSH iron-sulfur domain-containing protein [Acidobacteria bacterium]|nr:CDGSH iron-sulfur domain-containing protein [Acidobacteriota bacterium]